MTLRVIEPNDDGRSSLTIMSLPSKCGFSGMLSWPALMRWETFIACGTLAARSRRSQRPS